MGKAHSKKTTDQVSREGAMRSIGKKEERRRWEEAGEPIPAKRRSAVQRVRMLRHRPQLRARHFVIADGLAHTWFCLWPTSAGGGRLNSPTCAYTSLQGMYRATILLCRQRLNTASSIDLPAALCIGVPLCLHGAINTACGNDGLRAYNEHEHLRHWKRVDQRRASH